MSEEYSHHIKTVFTLSMFANLAAGKTGRVPELEQELYKDINEQLAANESKIGPWSIFWGPAIYQAPESNVADNTFYLARQEGTGDEPDKIVVAIAGTNGNSLFGWLILDFWVSAQMPWIWGLPHGNLAPRIAMGTMVGLAQLQHLRPSLGLPGAWTKFQDFVRDKLTRKTSLTVTGHSLGGALAPVTALWLSDTQDQWNAAGHANLSCVPSAGATPGNRDFAAYYDLPEKMGNRTTRIHNGLDIVPHAWSLDDLAKIPDLYQPYIEPDGLVKLFVGLAENAARNGDYQQIQLGAPPITSRVIEKLIDPERSDFANFMVQALYQHIEAYYLQLDIHDFEPVLNRIESALDLLAVDGEISRLENLLLEQRRIEGSSK